MSFIRTAHLPGDDRFFAHLDRYLNTGDPTDAATVFGRIYRRGAWGHGTASGGGSTATEAAPYIDLVNGLCRVGRWEWVVDLACGDGAITRQLQPAGRPIVTGVDVYAPHLDRLRREAPQIRNWMQLDIDRDRDKLPIGDVALLKDTIHHWPNALIRAWLDWARTAGKWQYVVLTYDVANAHAGDIPLGGYRALSVDLPPLAGLGLRRLCRYLHKEVAILECT